MPFNVSSNNEINLQAVNLDKTRRKLGIASLKGKIKSSLELLKFANEVCNCLTDEKTEGETYVLIESIYASLSEIKEHADVGSILCVKVVGDKKIPPLEKFYQTVKSDNSTV